MAKAVILFVEGDTEEDFYKKIVQIMRERLGNRLKCHIEVKNVKGIGNYSSKVPRTFQKQVIPKYPSMEYEVFLCFDTDVFDLAAKPPVNLPKLRRALFAAGANKVNNIKAKLSIEDWFLYDKEGVLAFLGLQPQTRICGKTGQNKLEDLFKKSNRVYIKGHRYEGFIQSLDIVKILKQICPEMKPLCIALGITCNGDMCN